MCSRGPAGFLERVTARGHGGPPLRQAPRPLVHRSGRHARATSLKIEKAQGQRADLVADGYEVRASEVLDEIGARARRSRWLIGKKQLRWELP
jgi:hypothetical protein